MSEVRRYDDDEVAEIFRRATGEGTGDGGTGPRAPSEGMSLQELEEIGREVGIAPDAIDRAARSLERRVDAAPVQRFLGAPRTVSRTFRLERPLTDHEWERVVAELRRTFEAKGRVETQGRLRSWTNGNLQVHVEPEGSGYAVRMRTKQGQTSQLAIVGGVFTGIGLLAAFGGLLGSGSDALSKGLMFLVAGLVTLLWARMSLPGWARTRAEQMEALAERIPRLLEE